MHMCERVSVCELQFSYMHCSEFDDCSCHILQKILLFLFPVKGEFFSQASLSHNQKWSAMVLCGTQHQVNTSNPHLDFHPIICIQNVCKSVSKSMWVNVFCSVFILYLKDGMTWKAWWVKMKKTNKQKNTQQCKYFAFCLYTGPISSSSKRIKLRFSCLTHIAVA